MDSMLAPQMLNPSYLRHRSLPQHFGNSKALTQDEHIPDLLGTGGMS